MALGFSAFLFAQAGRQGAAKAGTVPDLSGVWGGKPNRQAALRNRISRGEVKVPLGYLNHETGDAGSLMDEPYPMKPWAKEAFVYNRIPPGTYGYAGVGRNELRPDLANCFPLGPTRTWSAFEFIQSPSRVLMFIQEDNEIRQFWIDGREHPKDFGHTWMGHSIGHWEGDVLVVDTIGLNDKTWLDSAGHVHTDALHLTERLRRVDHDTMTLDMTIDDPKAYTKPFTVHKTFALKPKMELEENILCEDHLDGDPVPLH